MSTPALPIIDHKKVAELQASVPQLVAQAQDLEIVDNDDYLASGSMLDRIIERRDAILAFFKKPAEDANNVHKFITSLRGTLVQPLDDIEELLKTRRKNFRQEDERARLKKEEAARKQAKDEAEQAALQQAAQMQEIGETAAAETILERAAMAPPPPVHVASEVPKEKGKSVRKTWKYKVVNEQLVKREFLMPDDSKIKPIVEKLGLDAMSIIGGIEVYPDETETIRRKK